MSALSLAADFADALSNPIAYQSKLEKHAEQLAVLEEDFDVEVSAMLNTRDQCREKHLV